MSGSACPFTETRGKHHEYLGMNLNFATIKNACAITQYDFMTKLRMSLLKDLKVLHRKTPATENLFKSNPNNDAVPEKQSSKHHETTAKSL